MKNTLFDVLEPNNNNNKNQNNSALAPFAPGDSTYTPVMSLAPIDSTSTPAPSSSMMAAPVESNLLAPVESNLLALVESNNIQNVFPSPSVELKNNKDITHNSASENKKMVEQAMIEMNTEKQNLNKKNFGVTYNNLSEASNLLRNTSLDPF